MVQHLVQIFPAKVKATLMLRNLVNLVRMSNNLNVCQFRSVTSIHGDQISEIHEVPMNVIIRPFPPELDHQKVASLMETISVGIQIHSQ